MASIKVSVQAEPRDIDSWSSLARRLESNGFEALVVGDHPGAGASPWPALGAAAAVTATLKLPAPRAAGTADASSGARTAGPFSPRAGADACVGGPAVQFGLRSGVGADVTDSDAALTAPLVRKTGASVTPTSGVSSSSVRRRRFAAVHAQPGAVRCWVNQSRAAVMAVSRWTPYTSK